MVDSWNHPMCDRCWDKNYRDLRGEPVRMKEPDMEKCCWCQGFCFSGIYQRNDPTDENMKCMGQHD